TSFSRDWSSDVCSSDLDVLPVLRDLQRTLERIYADKAVLIDVACPPDLAFRGARQDLEEMLGNLLDNACKWAAGKVTVRAEGARSEERRVGKEGRTGWG